MISWHPDKALELYLSGRYNKDEIMSLLNRTDIQGAESMVEILDKIDSVMYYPILIIVMALAGIYFTVLTKGVQIRLFAESVRLLKEPAEDKKDMQI